MAGQFIEGFDTWATAADGIGKGWTIIGTGGQAALSAGGYAPSGQTYVGQGFANTAGYSAALTRPLSSAQGTVTLGAAHYWQSGLSAGGVATELFAVSNQGTVLCSVTQAADVSTLNVVDSAGGTHTLTGLTNPVSIWTYLEAQFVAGGTGAGTVTVRQDGITLGSVGCSTTIGTLTYDGVVLGTGYVHGSLSVIDHVYCTDGSGTRDTGFAGPFFVQTLYPNADSGTQGWTPDTGTTSYTRVNEAVQDGLGTYLTSNGPGMHSQFTLAALSGEPGSILGIQPVVTAMGAGTTMADTVSSNGTVSTSASATLTTAFVTRSRFLDSDPATGARWDTAGINAAVVGIVSGTS